MLHRILCAIDDTEPSRLALRAAADLSRDTGADLEIAMVHTVLRGSRGPAITIYTDEEVERTVTTAKAQARARGAYNVSSSVLMGSDIAAALVHHADETGVDHIVAGTRGKGTLARLLQGSVAIDMVNLAHCPVTIVR
jgi:nucleotide-binding universal stress UspA family protein